MQSSVSFGVIDGLLLNEDDMEFILDAARLRDVNDAVINKYVPNKIQAIKRVREATDLSLRDSLIFVNGVFAAFDASRR